MHYSKRLAASLLLFPDQQSLHYYDEIAQNKSRGLERGGAIECYGNLHHSMDAIIKLIYDEKVHYDVVFQAPNKDDCVLQDLYIQELLKLGCIISKQTSPLNENVGFVLVLMPFWRLVIEAERIQLKLPLRSEEFQAVKARFWGANKRPFFGIDRWRRIDLDGEIKALNGRFTANRMKYFLDSTSKINVDLFSNAQRNFLCFNIIHQITVLKDSDEDPLDLEGLINLDVFTSYYPLHDGPADTSRKSIRSLLTFSWKGWLKPQPVHEIREYFGERIAFHFAWMDHSTWWLFLLGIVGIFVFLYGLIKAVILNRNSIKGETLKTIKTEPFYATVFDNEMTIVFGFITSVWGLIQILYWRRREKYLSIFWTTDKYLVEETPRPLWKYSVKAPNPITGEMEPYQPMKEVISKRLITFIGVVATCLLLAGNVLLYLTYNSAIRNRFKANPSMSRYSALISAIISFITIQLLSPFCSWVSVKLNDYENHKTQTQYHDSLITKNLTFEFVNYYGIIAYIAVGRAWVIRSSTGLFGESTLADSCFSIDPNSDSNSCMMDLTIQMAVIFIARALVRHFLNFLEPIYSKFFEGMKYGGFSGGIKSIRSKYTYKASNTADIPQLYVDMSLTSVDLWSTHLDGYESATVQMGFIIFFSLAFPLAPILAAIHNIIQWRIDAHNLLYRYKRPFALQAANIGVWDYWIVMIAYLGVAMNALILSFTSQFIFDRINDFSTRTQSEQWQVRLLFILIFEHAVLFVVLIINILIPSMLDRAIISLKRQAYIESFLSGELKKLS